MSQPHDKPNTAQTMDKSNMYHLVYVRTLQSKLASIEHKILSDNKANVNDDIDEVNELLSTYLAQNIKTVDETNASDKSSSSESFDNYYLVSSDDDSSDDDDKNDVHLQRIKKKFNETKQQEEYNTEDKLRMEHERDKMINDTIIKTDNLKFTHGFINITCEEEEDEDETDEKDEKDDKDNKSTVSSSTQEQSDSENQKAESVEKQENLDMMTHDKLTESSSQ